MNLWENAGFLGGFNSEATSRVVQVEKDAAVFFGDGFQRARDEFVAVASGGTENVSGEAVRMHTHQGRLRAPHIAPPGSNTLSDARSARARWRPPALAVREWRRPPPD